MFFIGGAPALLALFVRFRVKESAVWRKTRAESWRGVSRAVLSNWKLFLYLTALMMMMNLASHGTQDMYPTFLQQQRGFSPCEVATIAIIYNLGALFGGIVFGWFSDRFGRRRGMLTALSLSIVLIPLWALAPGAGWLVLGACLMQFMVQGAWGIIPAHIMELSPGQVRGFLPGFAYQCGVLLAGNVAYIEALFARRLNYATAMAVTALTVFVMGLVVIALGRERHGADFSGNSIRTFETEHPIIH
jgi:MFS transporter, SHS family, lactate transporter